MIGPSDWKVCGPTVLIIVRSRYSQCRERCRERKHMYLWREFSLSKLEHVNLSSLDSLQVDRWMTYSPYGCSQSFTESLTLCEALRRTLPTAFVDIKSAFDFLDRKTFWRVLRSIRVPDVLLSFIRDLHCGTEAWVRVGNSDWFQTSSSGVHQGCILAPALICTAIYWIMRLVPNTLGVLFSDTAFSDYDYI